MVLISFYRSKLYLQDDKNMFIYLRIILALLFYIGIILITIMLAILNLYNYLTNTIFLDFKTL